VLTFVKPVQHVERRGGLTVRYGFHMSLQTYRSCIADNSAPTIEGELSDQVSRVTRHFWPP
jgi:hypothetical protein